MVKTFRSKHKLPRILVCGSRNYTDYRRLSEALDTLCYDRDWITEKDDYGNWLPACRIVTGKAKGADELAATWAVVGWTDLREYPADWEKHGRAAGPIRNKEMLEKEDPDLVVAFPSEEKISPGTKHMISIAEKTGYTVIIVRPTFYEVLNAK